MSARSICKNTLSSLHASARKGEQYFYSVSLSLFKGLSFEEIKSQFMAKRSLRYSETDYLRKSGNLVLDFERSRIITGSDSSRMILEDLFQVKMTLKRRIRSLA